MEYDNIFPLVLECAGKWLIGCNSSAWFLRFNETR
jgi:hypothetical protein